MLRKLLTLAYFATIVLTATAFPVDSLQVSDRLLFNHLDASVNAGTAGLGLEISTPVTKYLKVRAGVTWMPRFSMPVSFGLESFKDGQVGTGSFASQQEMMKKLTGIEVDDRVDMDCKPHLVNFRFLIDVYPWEDSRWHITAGFFAGPRKIASAVNSINEMHSLFAVNLYNDFYEKALSPDFDKTLLFGTIKLTDESAAALRDKMIDAGEVGIHVGDFKDGRPYIMTPDEDGEVRATAYVNIFRPYLGFGYSGHIAGSKRLSVGFDAGVLVWGQPKIITHDGVNLVSQVTDIRGKVGDYVDVMRSFRVFPVVELKVTYKIF